jgi:serine/threonine-protein kinase
LLTARPVFSGETVTEILGGVMRAEPDWFLLPKGTPSAIITLLRRCLTKDPSERSRDAADIRHQIQDVRAAAAASAATVVVQAPAPAPRRWLVMAVLACLLTAAIGGIAVWRLRPGLSPTSAAVTRFAVSLGAGDKLVFGGAGQLPALALSPDGKQLAYAASRGGGQTQLYLRAMDSLESKPLSSMAEASYPFFSPDGQWVGFAVAQTLRRVSTSGGAPLTMTSAAATPFGVTWGANDTIAFPFGATSGLFSVPVSGGTPQVLTALKGENSHRWPEFLPGGKAVLFTNWITGADTSQIVVQQLDTGDRRVVVQGGTFPRYVPTGHLVFVRAGTLMAIPFDPVRLEVKGTPIPVVEGVMQNSAGAGMFSFSDTGTLVYVPGGLLEVKRQLVWVARRGVEQPLAATPRAYYTPAVSPDGRRVAVQIQGDIWIFDILRGTLSRLTFTGANSRPLWSLDGTRVAYSTSKGGPPNLWWKPADGTGAEEQVTKSETFFLPSSFSPDRILAYVETRPETNRDIYVQPLEGDRKPRPWLQTRFDDTVPEFSPDGKWIAYVSNESGRYEIYVQPYPGPGGKWLISTEGGEQPLWNPNGKELFYRIGDKEMAVEITTAPAFNAGTPKVLFEGHYERQTGPGPNYSISPDGQRFLMVKAAEQQDSPATQINVVLNWFEEPPAPQHLRAP